jgi:hypothetical protein
MLSLLFKLKTYKINYLYFIKNKLLHSNLNDSKESEIDENQLISNNYNSKLKINRKDSRSYIPIKTIRNIYREYYKENKKVLDKNSQNLNVYDKVKEELLAASIAESQLKLKKHKEEMEINISKPIDKKSLSLLNKNKLNKNKLDKNKLDKNITKKDVIKEEEEINLKE